MALMEENSMARQRKRFQAEFRMECAELVLDHGYSVREAAEAMDVVKSTVGKWVTQLKAERTGTTTGSAVVMGADQARIKELEKQVKRLEIEKQILKTATALLMSDSLNGSR